MARFGGYNGHSELHVWCRLNFTGCWKYSASSNATEGQSRPLESAGEPAEPLDGTSACATDPAAVFTSSE